MNSDMMFMRHSKRQVLINFIYITIVLDKCIIASFSRSYFLFKKKMRVNDANQYSLLHCMLLLLAHRMKPNSVDNFNSNIRIIPCILLLLHQMYMWTTHLDFIDISNSFALCVFFELAKAQSPNRSSNHSKCQTACKVITTAHKDLERIPHYGKNTGIVAER